MEDDAVRFVAATSGSPWCLCAVCLFEGPNLTDLGDFVDNASVKRLRVARALREIRAAAAARIHGGIVPRHALRRKRSSPCPNWAGQLAHWHRPRTNCDPFANSSGTELCRHYAFGARTNNVKPDLPQRPRHPLILHPIPTLRCTLKKHQFQHTQACEPHRMQEFQKFKPQLDASAEMNRLREIPGRRSRRTPASGAM
ncbi:hypothetical protein RI054_30g121500 [Pseudoscourfieldia marina]